jgi:hypothetical protein
LAADRHAKPARAATQAGRGACTSRGRIPTPAVNDALPVTCSSAEVSLCPDSSREARWPVVAVGPLATRFLPRNRHYITGGRVPARPLRSTGLLPRRPVVASRHREGRMRVVVCEPVPVGPTALGMATAQFSSYRLPSWPKTAASLRDLFIRALTAIGARGDPRGSHGVSWLWVGGASHDPPPASHLRRIGELSAFEGLDPRFASSCVTDGAEQRQHSHRGGGAESRTA